MLAGVINPMIWKILKFVIVSIIEYMIFQATDLTPTRCNLDASTSDDQKSTIWMRQATLVFCISIVLSMLNHVPVILLVLGCGSLYSSIYYRYKHLYQRQASIPFDKLSSLELSKSISNGNPPEYVNPQHSSEFVVIAFANIFANCRELCSNLISCQDCQHNLPSSCWEDQSITLIMQWLKHQSRDASNISNCIFVPFECPLRFYRRILSVMSFRLKKTPATSVFTHDFISRFSSLREMASRPITNIREFLIKISTLLEEDQFDSKIRCEYLRLYSDLAWIIACRSDIVTIGLFHCQFLITWSCDGYAS
ncbi:hypothetical protein GJ496_000762 [Pomphorhynchus laevis]|nr:hypothetical protein GJ496_000762 [Pomphorhynchus laevis]